MLTSKPALSNVEAVNEYALKRPLLVSFTTKLEVLLRDLLQAQKLEFHLIESRTKDVVSLKEKINRSSKSYRDPLSEVSDLCGLRVITYYQDHADAIGRLIQEEFLVDDGLSVLHSSQGAEFGYRSSHFVVRLSPTRSALLEWGGFDAICAEIQVRTVLQHAWAAISHKLQYKREEDVPIALKRKLFRLSALFELADDEFVSLRDASGEVRKEITAQLATGERSILLDSVSLDEYISTSLVVMEICADAESAGFSFETPDNEIVDEDDSIDRLSDTLRLATIAGLTTVEDFDAVLNRAVRWSKEYLHAQYIAGERESSSTWYATAGFICELILIASYADLFRVGNLLMSGYERTIANRVFEVAKSFLGARTK
ncbi:GTP pyrophosphokinase [Iodobacter fluviatilis]|uniref:GTP pyrophosphokinase yjbM n=1 Tax=Iodobacter fluviatilis TaxID=537 RepID=A0A377Q8D3_9NEIS|nr:hypothetical protein [Iodobacter fluviatilis]TCU88841.1 ppGpp synthetase/RelA/SpoT-type nucleotidyltransferase [Iodobacter fluviatilis]STQ91087.1 GTP pyrophosphokinase yjbM [Iodobacter fluviatilis]